MGVYRMVRGRWRRFEGGVLRQYVVGDLVELDEGEARRLAHCVEPVGSSRPGPSRGGVEVPTATTAVAKNVKDLRRVIGGETRRSVLHDIEEQERAGKRRVTVFRALAKRREELDEEG